MKISVIIPLFNKKDTIIKALESIFNQTVQPLEIIVVNDGSTDGSVELVEQVKHPLTRLINQKNAGVSIARNRGINEAKGDWIAFLDADDFWDNDFLETINKLSNKYPSASVLITKYRYFCNETITLPEINFDSTDGILKDYFRTAAGGSPPIWTGAVCVKKKALTEIGYFPIEVKIGEDLLTWARLSLNCEIAYSSEAKSNYLLAFNFKSNQQLKLPDEIDFVGSELIKLLHNNRNNRSIKQYIYLWHKMRLHLYAHHSLPKKCFVEFLNCLKYNPFNYKAYLLMVFAILPISLKDYILSKKEVFK